MTKILAVLTLAAATTFAAIVVVDGAVFPIAIAGSPTDPVRPTTIPVSEATIIPIEDLAGTDPEPCAIEVCSSNFAFRPARRPEPATR